MQFEYSVLKPQRFTVICDITTPKRKIIYSALKRKSISERKYEKIVRKDKECIVKEDWLEKFNHINSFYLSGLMLKQEFNTTSMKKII